MRILIRVASFFRFRIKSLRAPKWTFRKKLFGVNIHAGETSFSLLTRTFLWTVLVIICEWRQFVWLPVEYLPITILYRVYMCVAFCSPPSYLHVLHDIGDSWSLWHSWIIIERHALNLVESFLYFYNVSFFSFFLLLFFFLIKVFKLCAGPSRVGCNM